MAQQVIRAVALPAELEHGRVHDGMVVLSEAEDFGPVDVETCQAASLRAVEHVLLEAHAEAYFAIVPANQKSTRCIY